MGNDRGLRHGGGRRLLDRRLMRCPGCTAPLKPWGRARNRTVVDRTARRLSARPDRARCTGYGTTHVVLHARLLPHRRYSAAVVGQALLASAAGLGIGALLRSWRSPAATVRGWLRRVQGAAPRLHQLGVQTVVSLDPQLLPTVERTDGLAPALGALGAAALAFAGRLVSNTSTPGYVSTY